jgi:hypothetical protein
MALRLLMYIARVYEKTIGSKNIYSGKKLPIPQPEFIVLYNGTAPYPDESTLKLSDSFEDSSSLGLAKGPVTLELAVKVYNINQGCNEAIVRNCQRLFGYSVFVAKVREFEKTAVGKEAAMKMAVRYCIAHDILKEILEANASEVINMLLEEWNLDDAKKAWQEEAWKEGRKEGREEGQNVVLELVKQGYTAEQIEAKLTLKTETAGK